MLYFNIDILLIASKDRNIIILRRFSKVLHCTCHREQQRGPDEHKHPNSLIERVSLFIQKTKFNLSEVQTFHVASATIIQGVHLMKLTPSRLTANI